MTDNQDNDLLANALLGGLRDILTKPLPGTKGANSTRSQKQDDPDEEEGLLERIKDILCTPLPGTKNTAESDQHPAQDQSDEDAQANAPTPSQSAPEQDAKDRRIAELEAELEAQNSREEIPEIITEHDWESMKRTQEREHKKMKNRHERERETMKRRHEQERKKMKRARKRK